MSAHVFICYAREDEEFALQLARMLKASAIRVWVDQWDIPPGANWVKSIDRALEECSTCLVVLSPDSVDSDEVMNEWATVRDEKKPIVPVLYRECHIPYRLRQTQWISFVGLSLDNEDARARLLSVLGGSAPPRKAAPALRPKLAVAAPEARPPAATPERAVFQACRACGAKTHPRTLQQTGGYCMKCYVRRKPIAAPPAPVAAPQEKVVAPFQNCSDCRAKTHPRTLQNTGGYCIKCYLRRQEDAGGKR